MRSVVKAWALPGLFFILAPLGLLDFDLGRERLERQANLTSKLFL